MSSRVVFVSPTSTMLVTGAHRNLNAIPVLLLNCGDHRNHSKDGHALFYQGQFAGTQLSAVSKDRSEGTDAEDIPNVEL